jgi:hypothetical protein
VRYPSAVAAALVAAAIASPAFAQGGNPANRSDNRLTIAVFGDWPYSPGLLAAAPLLLNSINSDPQVRFVIHVGDIHSGSMPCTGAGLDPLPAGSVPGWNLGIFDIFEQFKDPLIYTPGDNEWTDCHKKKESFSGAPLNELAAVRNLFFPVAGQTLGERNMSVLSQATAFDANYLADAQFIENVLWEQSRVVFVTLNIPGSNDDGLTWTAPFTNEPARIAERTARDAANLRWLQKAFEMAETDDAIAVVVAIQADMFDPAALLAGGDGLNNYTPFVQALAARSLHFGKPVLLLNGDSHLFEVDHPLADPTSDSGKIHATPAVPNLTRITVQGSTNNPREWLRLTIDPRDSNVFSWSNVVYCDVNTTCPDNF